MGVINDKNNVVNSGQVDAKIDATNIAGRCAHAPGVFAEVYDNGGSIGKSIAKIGGFVELI